MTELDIWTYSLNLLFLRHDFNSLMWYPPIPPPPPTALGCTVRRLKVEHYPLLCLRVYIFWPRSVASRDQKPTEKGFECDLWAAVQCPCICVCVWRHVSISVEVCQSINWFPAYVCVYFCPHQCATFARAWVLTSKNNTFHSCYRIMIVEKALDLTGMIVCLC